MVFTFSVLDQENPFWVNLVKKIKIVSYSWNLVASVIWISGIQWWCSLFYFWPYLLWVNLVQKFKIVRSKWNLIERLIFIFLVPKCPFCVNLLQNFKSQFNLRRNLVPTFECLEDVPPLTLIDFSIFSTQNILFPPFSPFY